LLLIGTLYMFVYISIDALYPLISMVYFQGTPKHVSITEIAYASIMTVDEVILGLLGRYKKKISLITVTIFMMGIGLAGSGLLPPNGFIVLVICCIIMGSPVPF